MSAESGPADQDVEPGSFVAAVVAMLGLILLVVGFLWLVMFIGGIVA